jgi:hypothetical protein
MASLLEQIGNDISKVFSPSLPGDLGTFDEHLDFIIPKVAPYGEDLSETNFWVDKRWREVRDDEAFHEVFLHIFNTGGEYMMVVDGNIFKGTWKQLSGSNSMIMEISGRSELFELRYLNNDFLILSKHGDQARKGQRRYFMLVRDGVARGKHGDIDWHNAMEAMFNVWRENSLSLWAWFIFILIIGLMVFWLR